MPTPVGGGELRAFDPFGKPIGTIWPVKEVNAAWAMGEVAPLTFSIPRVQAAGSRWNSTFLRFLNRIEYHHYALPYPWIGRIIDHSPAGPDCRVTCASAEIDLFGRLSDEYWESGMGGGGVETAGQTIAELYRQGVRRAPMWPTLQQGKVFMGGPSYNLNYQLAVLGEAFDEIAETTGGAWWVEKLGTGWRDPAFLCYERVRGKDKSGSVCISGEVPDDPDMRTSAQEIKTALYGIGSDGSGDGGGNLEDRIKLYRRYREAEKVYGLWEGTLDLPEVYDLDLLNEALFRKLTKLGRPSKTLGVNVDNRFSIWGKFWIGDTVRVNLPNVDFMGLDAKVRVKGIQLDVDAWKLGLAVEVLQ